MRACCQMSSIWISKTVLVLYSPSIHGICYIPQWILILCLHSFRIQNALTKRTQCLNRCIFKCGDIVGNMGEEHLFCIICINAIANPCIFVDINVGFAFKSNYHQRKLPFFFAYNRRVFQYILKKNWLKDSDLLFRMWKTN